MERFGRVDVLVNCAGIITRTPMLDLAHEDWHQVINVNLHGTYYMCQAVLPQMCEQQSGKIINITSQMASMPHPGASPSYEVSKAAMAALTRHMALHFASHNIQINAVAPGSIDTDLPKSMSPEARQQLKDAIPLLRLGEPEEVAELVAFLASSKANYINGATIPINGGSFMSP
jgi:3-oxoacyl-[acyl-carrier protein] reductase